MTIIMIMIMLMIDLELLLPAIECVGKQLQIRGSALAQIRGSALALLAVELLLPAVVIEGDCSCRQL